MNIQIPEFSSAFAVAASPIFILLSFATLLMMMSVSKKFGNVLPVLYTVEIGIVAALVATLCQALSPAFSASSFLASTLMIDRLALYGSVLVLLMAFVVTVLMKEHHLRAKFFRGEIGSIFLFSVSGMLIMMSSDDMITLFVGLELASIALYALIGYINAGRLSVEGAIKYFILGSVAAAVLLFGFAFLYAATGSMQISVAMQTLAKLGDHPWGRLALILIVSGFGFKLALVPFHLWSPDAYEAAPSSITAFMATAVKVMIMVAALRFLPAAMLSGSNGQLVVSAMSFLAVLTVIFANIMALVQVNLRRLFAYSSIAHSGYLAIALASFASAGAETAMMAIILYLFIYSAVTAGVFAILMWFESEANPHLTVDDLNGLAKRHPKAAFALAVFLFSLGGMPPSAVFIGKFFLFNAVIKSNLTALVIFAAIGSTISLYYYLRLIVRMYMSESSTSFHPVPQKRAWRTASVVVVCLVLNILMGTVLPSWTLKVAKHIATESLPG